MWTGSVTASNEMKPNLFIVGAPKCGTTAWYEYLRHHPDVFFPDVKEPSHFLTDFPKWPAVRDRGDYLSLYEAGGNASVLGDASPHYLFSREAAKNISQFNPDARILIFVRDHFPYLQSLHNQHLFSGIECIRDFRTAWELSGNRDADSIPSYFKEPGLLDYKQSAEFAPQIDRFYDAFPSDQIRVFHLENWTADARATYREIVRFLGLDDDGRTHFPKINEAHFQWLGIVQRFVRNPPRAVRKLVEAMRRAAGRQGLGAGKLLVRLNTGRGRLVEIDDALRREITEYYKHDAEKLAHRIWRP